MEGIPGLTARRPSAIDRMRRDPGAILGFIIVAAAILIAFLAPWLPLNDPTDLNLDNRLLPPSAEFLLGAAHLGRDELSRIIFGARFTVLMAGSTVAIIMFIALVVGSLSGYYGGWIDISLMLVVDLLLAFPSLILGVAVAGI